MVSILRQQHYYHQKTRKLNEKKQNPHLIKKSRVPALKNILWWWTWRVRFSFKKLGCFSIYCHDEKHLGKKPTITSNCNEAPEKCIGIDGSIVNNW